MMEEWKSALLKQLRGVRHELSMIGRQLWGLFLSCWLLAIHLISVIVLGIIVPILYPFVWVFLKWKDKAE